MSSSERSAIALGSFDGLHKGHKAVIACALSYREHGLVPHILLFDSHPLLTLKGKAPDELLQNSVREELITEMGAVPDYISFPEIMNMSPEEFFSEILIKKYNAGALCCGWNYRFGKEGRGDCEKLKQLCSSYGIGLNICPPVEYKGQPISSSRIRSEITDGNICDANAMLGREFEYRNLVVSGNHRGRLMGAPTINQYFDEGFIIPKNGVYSSVTTLDGVEFPSVTNIGLRPSFENEDLRSETFIIGFDGDLYGQIIGVKLTRYLRDEIKFACAAELKTQIKEDEEKSKEIFLKGREQSRV